MGDSSLRRRLVNAIRTMVGTVYLLLGKPFLGRLKVTFVFHEVSDEPRAHARETRTFSSIVTFQKQINWIRESFDVQDLREADDRNGCCIVSFDDGYAGVALNALPLLEKARLPFICFINASTIRGELNSSALAMYVARKEKRQVNWSDSNPTAYIKVSQRLSESDRKEMEEYQGPYLTGEDLKNLSLHPLVSIGDHLYNHWFLNELSEAEIEDEVRKNQSELRRFDSYRDYLATPHGVASRNVLALLAKHSYKKVFSGDRYEEIDGLAVFPRIDLNNDVSSERRFFGAIIVSLLRPYVKDLLKKRTRNVS